MESTTALSSTSRIDDGAHDALGVGQRLERGVCPALQKLSDGIGPRRDADRPHAERAPALNVGRRIADDNEILALQANAELVVRALSRDRRQLRAILVVAAERADPKPIRFDARRTKLRQRTLSEIPGEQPEDGIAPAFEGGEQFEDAGVDERGDLSKLILETLEIAPHQHVHPLVDVRVMMPLEPHDLTNDLRIGLAIIPMVFGTRRSEDLAQRGEHRPPPGAIALKDGAVDVEEHETRRALLHHSGHGSAVRVRSTPAMIPTAPTSCHTLGFSPSITRAATSAKMGWRLPKAAVRVGPSSRTPRFQNR